MYWIPQGVVCLVRLAYCAMRLQCTVLRPPPVPTSTLSQQQQSRKIEYQILLIRSLNLQFYVVLQNAT